MREFQRFEPRPVRLRASYANNETKAAAPFQYVSAQPSAPGQAVINSINNVRTKINQFLRVDSERTATTIDLHSI